MITKFFKKLKLWFNTQIVWLLSKRVQDAINSGASYEEVEKIVKEEAEKQ